MAKLGARPKNTEHVSAAVQAQIDAAEARRKRLGLAEQASAASDAGGDPNETDSDTTQ